MKRFAFKESAAVAAGLTGAFIVACSQGPEEPATVAPTPSASTVASTPPGGASSAAPVVAGSNTAATPGASSAAGPLVIVGTATTATADTTPDIPGVVAAWTAGDGVTTIALKQDPATPGKICMEGNAPDSAVGSDMYKNWGAALGLNLRLSDGTPWDAKALEIAGFTFDMEVTSGSRPIRIQMGQIDDPAISKLTFPASFASGACVTAKDDCNYGKNSFVFGGNSPKDQKASSKVSVDLAKVAFPNWTKVPKLDANGMWPTDAAAAGTGAAPAATMTPVAAATGTGAAAPLATMTPVGSSTAPAATMAMPAATAPAAGGMPVYALATGQVIDLTKLASLQFQVVTAPTMPGPYQFCISNLKWVKADLMTEVVVPKRVDVQPAASGSAPAGTAPVVSTAPMGSSTAPVVSTAPMGSSTAPAPSGTAMAGNAALDAAFPIFTANCTSCHMGAHGISTDKATVQKMTKKDADDIVKAVTTGSSAGNVMPKGKTALSAGDIDKLKAWAATRM